MTDNPYQSPQCTELADLDSAELDPRDRRGRAWWVMMPVGLLAGSIVIAIVGALGAGALGLILIITSPPDRGHLEEVVLAMAAVGGVFGAVGGAVIGGVAGMVAGLSRMRIRNGFVWSTTVVTGLYGCAVGLSGGFIPMVGMIGAIAGGCGGWMLAERMAWFCWGHLLKKRLPEIPARSGQ